MDTVCQANFLDNSKEHRKRRAFQLQHLFVLFYYYSECSRYKSVEFLLLYGGDSEAWDDLLAK